MNFKNFDTINMRYNNILKSLIEDEYYLKIERRKLTSERLDELKTKQKQLSFICDVKNEIETFKKRYPHYSLVKFNLLGIDSDIHIFYSDKAFYEYHSIYDLKFDGGGEQFEPLKLNEDILLQSFLRGLCVYSTQGVRNLLGLTFMDHPLTNEDFEIEQKLIDVRQYYPVKSNYLGGAFLFDKTLSLNSEFIFKVNPLLLSKIVVKFEDIADKLPNIRILSLDEMINEFNDSDSD